MGLVAGVLSSSCLHRGPLPESPDSMCIRCCTANALTLHPAEERKLSCTWPGGTLVFEFTRRRLDVIGVQEARSGDAIFRRGGKYIKLSSAAGRSLSGSSIDGCELWLHERLGCNEANFVVLVSTPSVLIVRSVGPLVPLLAVVGHAPTSAASDDALAAWWSRLRQWVRQFRKDGEFTVLLLDANALVVSAESPFVGEVDP